MKNHYDVIIVGGGMVGLSCALALSQQTALRIRVIEQGKEPQFDIQQAEQRVSAINKASQQWLTQLGVWPSIAATRISPYRAMQVWDSQGHGHIHFDSQQIAEPDLGHIIENDLIAYRLYQAIQQQPQIDLAFAQQPRTLKRDTLCQLELDNGQTIQAALVIGADGAHSWVRQQSQLGLTQYDYGHHAIVCQIACEQAHQDTAWQVFLPTGPLALLPLANPQHCSIVWSCVPDLAQRLLQQDNATFSASLTQAFGTRLGNLNAVTALSSFPLSMRQAHHYTTQGIALIGDAAHTIHPLAGQGVNMGFLDAIALVHVIVQAVQKQQPIGHEQVLQRYQRARKGHNLLMAGMMQSFKSLFTSQQKPLATLRNLGMQGCNQWPWLKKQIMLQAMGLDT